MPSYIKKCCNGSVSEWTSELGSSQHLFTEAKQNPLSEVSTDEPGRLCVHRPGSSVDGVRVWVET